MDQCGCPNDRDWEVLDRRGEALEDEITSLRAKNARLRDMLAEYMATPDDGVEVDAPPMQLRPELQPCGHPVQAIRHGTDDLGPGGEVTNWCGWCADIAQFEREHELCQTLTAELLEYRGQVARLQVEITEERAQVAAWMGVTKRAQTDAARLREALEAVEWVEGAYAGSMTGYKYFGEQCPWCGQRPGHGHRSDCLRGAALSTPTNDWLAQHDAEVRQEEREQCAAFLEDFAKHYPENVFIPPPPGEHGKTVDACSAAAIRAILPILAAAIRESTT